MCYLKRINVLKKYVGPCGSGALPPLLSPVGRAGCLSHLQGNDCLSPFSPEGVLPILLSVWPLGFSLLEALKKDGPGQRSGHSQAAQPRTCGPRKVYVNIVLYFPSSNTFLAGCLFALVRLSPLAAQSCFPALPLSIFGLRWDTVLPDQPPTWPPREPSDLSGLEPGGSSWVHPLWK